MTDTDPTTTPARPRMSPFPHHYEVVVDWRGREGGRIESADRPRILGGPPPEFGGPAHWWSPEHLLLSSVGLCLMTTFQALADRQGLDLRRCDNVVEGTLDKTPDGLRFTSIVVHADVEVAEADIERARNLLQSAKRHCIVSGSLRTPVEVQSTVHGV